MKTCIICREHIPCGVIHLQKSLDHQRELILDDVQIAGHGCGEETQTNKNELIGVFWGFFKFRKQQQMCIDVSNTKIIGVLIKSGEIMC